jgi:23S rRNA (cytosine1962-C5)-methyltransferase
MYPKLILKPNRERSLLLGHPWLFSGAIARCQGACEAGDIVIAETASGHPLAVGFYHPHTDIAFRLLSRDPDTQVTPAFLRSRLQEALRLRHKILPPETDAFRLVNAEGDGLPGLVVDSYGPFLVLSIATAGMERLKGLVLDILGEIMAPRAIQERSDGRARSREGLEPSVGPLAGSPPAEVKIRENGLYFTVDMITGQKTGFFLDQRNNRETAGRLAAGAKVLNCFSYSGGFSLYAGRGRAQKVVSVDISPQANQMASQNWAQNGLPSGVHQVITADVFDFLKQDTDEYDLVILDPPAFARQAKDVARAAGGYREINRLALARLRPGGLFFTFSCSNFVDEELFTKIVLNAGRDAGKTLQLLSFLGPGYDHPVGPAHREGRYLKGLFLTGK